MGLRIGIAGDVNTGKSWGRRYIPDGENCIVIQPSVKRSYLFTGPANADKLTAEQLDEAVKAGTRMELDMFDLSHPSGKWANLHEAALKQEGSNATMFPSQLHMIQILAKAIRELVTKNMLPSTGSFFKKENLKGNIIFCERIEDLKIYIQFINDFLPWVHTIILPDFTHYITSTLTADDFRARKLNGEQYAKYLDLAADGLKNFITSSNTLRPELILVTEYHVELNEDLKFWELFLPGGKMMKEKFKPSSYYDVFLFTNVQFGESEEDLPTYNYITRKTQMYPEARSSDLYDPKDLRVPNNLQDVLTRIRRIKNIEIGKPKKKAATAA